LPTLRLDFNLEKMLKAGTASPGPKWFRQK